MKTKLLIATLMTGGMLFTQVASAHDEAFGALAGGITGAAIGHAIDGRDAAVAGAVFGAILGTAIASEHDYREPPRVAYRPPVVYGPSVGYSAPVVYGPPVIYEPRPVFAERCEPRWEHERHHGWGDRDEGRGWGHERRWEHDGDRDGHHRW